MGNIKTYKLGDIVNVLDYKRIPLSSTQRQNKKGIYPYYGAQGIIDYIDDYIFDGEYLLIAEDGENLKSQKQHVAQIATGKYWVNNHAHIVESNGLCDIRYVCYLLNRMDLSGYITGSAQPKLNQANLLKIEIKLPSLKEQYKIAEFLHLFDGKIELNRRINENLEQQAQALFKSWFVDFEPFKNGKFVDSELGMIPEGWEVGQLLDFGKIICGKTPSKNIKEFFGGDIPFIKIPDMHNQLFIINTEDSLSVEGNQTQQTKLLPPYSLLVSCIATVGLVAINTRPSHTNQQINSIVPQNKNSLYYLYLNLTLMKKQLENMGRGGTATLNINTTSFGKTRMIIPNNEVLDKFSHIVEPLFKEIEILSKQTFELAQLRDILLPKLMSGELEINDFNN